MIVKRFCAGGRYEVPIGTTAAIDLPIGFVIPPGSYILNGSNYECSQEGYYLFWDPLGGSAQRRIIYDTNIQTLMSSLTHALSIGAQDDALTTAQITNASVNRRPQILCGFTIQWAKAICDSLLGIGMTPVISRIVEGLTAGTPSGYFDSHAMLEVKVGGAWQLFDIAAGNDFGRLAAKDIFPLVAPPARWIRKKFSTSAVVAGLYDCDAWESLTLNSDEEFGAEFQRVLQIPGIQGSDGLIHCYLPDGMEGVESYATACGWVVENKAQWLAEFYP